ncbi:MAG: tRNA (5-methylaminomethyl-2-thiouridine)(34)-methyltransferase MnmD [bacterium]
MTNSLKVVVTKDGSHTLFVPELNEHYHSSFGAVTESRHVFIEAGFREASRKLDRLKILEVGFGTGLNALLTLLEAEKLQKEVSYTAIEAYPLDITLVGKLNYPELQALEEYPAAFRRIHLVSWIPYPPSLISHQQITNYFSIQKIHCSLEDYRPSSVCFDLIYFDAFAPDKQPEMWSEKIFASLSQSMVPGGILVTYCVKGEIVRRLKSLGFLTEKLPGPPGKRHMLRAIKM